MFETPLVDDTYELWPFNFEIYIILAYKVLPKDYDTFDMLARQLSHTIQVLRLYRGPKADGGNEVKMSNPDFEPVTKPFREIYSLLEEDGAFLAAAKYRPSKALVQRISKLMHESAVNLLWKVGYQPITDQQEVAKLSRQYESTRKSNKRKTDRSAIAGQNLKHDIAKLFLDSKANNENVTANSFSHDPKVREKVLVMARALKARCVENNVGRRIRDTLSKKSLESISCGDEFISRTMSQ